MFLESGSGERDAELLAAFATVFAWKRVRGEADRWTLLPRVVLTFTILHLVWGIGFWQGWLDVLLGQTPLA